MSQLTSVSSYRGYTLDPFQMEAIAAIQENKSVLVSAPTGTGKTLIADYLIEQAFRQGHAVIYTAPIKALSNQKFKEFKQLLGEEHVGILTGDVVINADAPVMIMTTEIFRNLLHQDPTRLQKASHAIFDEIHYIDDPTRGSVWEESLIFMPPHMQFLGLSATIPNVDELARWIGSVQKKTVKVIRHHERAVPLQHRLFESGHGFITLKQLKDRYKRYARRLGVKGRGTLEGAFPNTTHMQLLAELNDEHFPCLFFAFSRRRCEHHAQRLAEDADFLTAEQKQEVNDVIEEQVIRHAGAGVRRLTELRNILLRGIGFHHAGLLPVVKDIVEELFEKRLIRVLYCTETFAVGLNFPCRTVCFDAMTKWDGTSFRALSNREYFQMAGRAGRRGIDEVGYVFSVVDLNYFNPREFPSMREADVEPLKSRFSLSYNTVLNLVRNYSETEIREILRKNYASYQAEEERSRLQNKIETLTHERERNRGKKEGKRTQGQLRVLRRRLGQVSPVDAYVKEFEEKRSLLAALDYLRDGHLTARGEFAAQINGHELLITELFFRGIFHDWGEHELNALCVSLDYEPRKGEGRARQRSFDERPVRRAMALIQSLEEAYLGFSDMSLYVQLADVAAAWSQGERFAEIMKGVTADEGDIVYSFRRAIDILRQVRNAAREDTALVTKLRGSIEKMDRDEVSILL